MHDDLAAAEAKLAKKQKTQVTSSQTPTIEFIDCDTEKEVHSPMPVVEEVIEHLQTVTDFFNNNETKDSIPNPRILDPLLFLILQLQHFSSHLSKLSQLFLLVQSHHPSYLNSITL